MRTLPPLLILALILLLDQPLRAEPGNWLFATLLRERTILTFERDKDSGKLVRRHALQCPAEPACMAVTPDHKTLLVSYRSTGQLASFAIQPDGSLKPLSVVAGGADPAYLITDPSGDFLLSAYYEANKVCVHKLGQGGAIAETPHQVIPTAEKAHGIAFDAKQNLVFVPHTGANRIYQFRWHPKEGKLTASDPSFLATPESHHPRHLMLHPSGQWAYVSDEAGDSVSVYSVDERSGVLEAMQTVSSLPAAFDGSRNATARCELSPDGRFVYVANRGHDSIACYRIDQRTGRVQSLGQVPTEQTPRSFSIEPTGRFLYAAGQGSGKIAVFAIRDDGTLERIATQASGPVSWWVLAVDVPGE